MVHGAEQRFDPSAQFGVVGAFAVEYGGAAGGIDLFDRNQEDGMNSFRIDRHGGISFTARSRRVVAVPERSKNVHHLFAAMFRVADQTLVLHIDDEIQHLQGDLPNQDRKFVGDLADIEGTLAPLDCQPHDRIEG